MVAYYFVQSLSRRHDDLDLLHRNSPLTTDYVTGKQRVIVREKQASLFIRQRLVVTRKGTVMIRVSILQRRSICCGRPFGATCSYALDDQITFRLSSGDRRWASYKVPHLYQHVSSTTQHEVRGTRSTYADT